MMENRKELFDVLEQGQRHLIAFLLLILQHFSGGSTKRQFVYFQFVIVWTMSFNA